jgi:hypothetical protein
MGACNGDVGAAAVCDADAGAWVCPAGSVSSDQCSGAPFCAGDQPAPLCEKQLGVCAGSRHRWFPDGGVDPSCDYGPNYEVLETRCDGLDNDCDGETDRRWSFVLSYQEPYGWYQHDVIETDSGYLSAIATPAGTPVLKYFDRDLRPSRPDVFVTGWDGGVARRVKFTRTADGVMMSIAGYQTPRWLATARLDGDGVPRTGGAPALSWIPLSDLSYLNTSAPSSDGTRVLSLFGARTDIIALLQDSQGNLVAGPTPVMTRSAQWTDFIAANAVVGTGPDRFLFVGYQNNTSMSYEVDPVVLRVQELSGDLSLRGPERDIRSGSFPGSVLFPPTASGAVPMLFGSSSWDMPIIFPVRWIPDVLDAGYDAGTIWAGGTWGAFSMDAQPSGDGFELAWEDISYESDGLYHWTVWDESVPDAGVNLNPGGAAFLSPTLPPEIKNLQLRRGRPGTWVAFVPHSSFDGGIELRAVTYCQP